MRALLGPRLLRLPAGPAVRGRRSTSRFTALRDPVAAGSPRSPSPACWSPSLSPSLGVHWLGGPFAGSWRCCSSALIAATDPVERRLHCSTGSACPSVSPHLVDAESLFNDGVAAVLFAVVLDRRRGRARVHGRGGPGRGMFLWMSAGGARSSASPWATSASTDSPPPRRSHRLPDQVTRSRPSSPTARSCSAGAAGHVGRRRLRHRRPSCSATYGRRRTHEPGHGG